MKIAAPCSYTGCRRTTRDASARCHDHRGKRVYSVPDPATLYPRPAKRSATKSYRLVDPTSAGGTREVWSYPVRSGSSLRRHRVDAPAVIERGPGGEILREEWWSEGKLHRIDGPAQSRYYESGAPARERWWVHGELTRIDGPAETLYDDDWEKVEEVWWLAGRRADRGIVPLLRDEQTHFVHQAIDASSYRALLLEGRNYGDVIEMLEAGLTTVEGMREVFGGAPIEWVRSWEAGSDR